MIGVTERAKKELKAILQANTDEPEACLRLISNEQGQLGLGIDKERQGDQVVEHDDSKVLVVENDLADSLQGITMDVQDSPEGEGARLVLSQES
ncbi:MAG TPA: adhesin [Dehalococcoidia bacterium]|nr:adhesin [Dehalococcoidia bacterium]